MLMACGSSLTNFPKVDASSRQHADPGEKTSSPWKGACQVALLLQGALFIHSAANGHLDGFQGLAVRNIGRWVLDFFWVHPRESMTAPERVRLVSSRTLCLPVFPRGCTDLPLCLPTPAHVPCFSF